MQEITQQLDGVRRTARRLLLAQAALRWLAIVVVVMLACGLVDFALRLPGWLRLFIVLGLAVMAIAGLVRAVADAWGFRPSLETLALRVERLYPQLAGSLASGVEFASHPKAYAESPRTSALVTAAVDDLTRNLEGVRVQYIIDPRRTLQLAAAAVLILLVFAGVTLTAPGATWLAAQRWLFPLGRTEWPRRTNVVSLMHEEVWPSDTPLRLRARVGKGYHADMRAWAIYRRVSPHHPEPWQWVLMNDQTATAAPGGDNTGANRGRFERLIDLAAQRPADTAPIEFYFQTGDDETARQRITLVDRPAIKKVWIEVKPPAYAEGLAAAQRVSLDEQAGPVGAAAALVGSEVTLRFELNKALAPAPTIHDWPRVLPGLAAAPGARFVEAYAPYAIEARFVLRQTLQSPIHVIDENGLTNLSERTYRVEATTDQPPAVSVVQPAADEAVLASAVLPVEAVAQDDLAVESIALEAQTSAKTSGATPVAGPVVQLKRATGRVNRLGVAQDLSVASLSVQPGDEVVLSAVARDVFDLDGRRHDPVRSTPRRLRIIDQATLVGQVRGDLAGVRQQAVKLEAQQRELFNAPPEKIVAGQTEIRQRLDAQAAMLRNIQDRLTRNRLDDPQLHELVQKAAQLVNQAGESSKRAGDKLEQSQRSEARAAQEDVAKSLTDLVSLLDQGRDTLALQMLLRQLIATQDALAGDTRQTLPRTMGQSPEQLSPEDRRTLAGMAEKQTALAGRAEALAQEMHAAAEAMSKDKKDPQDQAAAQAIQDAAAIAQRQGLQQAMQKAADATKQNQLSDAGQAQQESVDTMKQMLDQLGSQTAREQEVLRRRLTALGDAIRQLVEQQKTQIERLKAATELAVLGVSMETLRGNTLAVAEEAHHLRAGDAVAKLVGDGATHQAVATAALHESHRDPAAGAERLALASLESALVELQKLEEQANAQKNRQERDELKAEYTKLAKEQEAILRGTTPLANVAQPTRPQRAALIDMNNRQAALHAAANKLAERVKETVLFAHMHEQIDSAAQRIEASLQAAEAGDDVLDDQASIATMLWTMAQALDDAQKQSDDFAGQSSGGQGGGGGSEAPRGLIPPMAQLKLLRGLEEMVYKRTVTASRQAAAGDAAQDRRRRSLEGLSVKQRDLASLGEQLIESLRASGPSAPVARPKE